MDPNPCLACGACCAHFRASFYWTEGEEATPGGVPAELTDPSPPHRLVMKGTNGPNPRCIALHGTIGRAVLCTIHPQRSTVCREFPPAWENGEPNERCDRARAAHGLPPLTPGDWRRPTEPERPDDRPDNSPPPAPAPKPARLDPAA